MIIARDTAHFAYTCHCDLAGKLAWNGLYQLHTSFHLKSYYTEIAIAHEAINATRARVASDRFRVSLRFRSNKIPLFTASELRRSERSMRSSAIQCIIIPPACVRALVRRARGGTRLLITTPCAFRHDEILRR